MSLPALLAGLTVLLGFLWVRDSYSLALRAFIFFIPYFFLFLSQDMFHDEIYSGALENTIFVNGGFQAYLVSKILILVLFGLAASSAIFGALAACGLVLGSGQITTGHLTGFFISALGGIYYLALGGYLSLFFRAGSNVLVIILGQVFLAIGFFVSMTARRGWVEAFLSDDFTGFVPKLRFLALTLVFPNAVILRRNPAFIAGLALASFGLLGLCRLHIRRLELFRR